MRGKHILCSRIHRGFYMRYSTSLAGTSEAVGAAVAGGEVVDFLHPWQLDLVYDELGYAFAWLDEVWCLPVVDENDLDFACEACVDGARAVKYGNPVTVG